MKKCVIFLNGEYNYSERFIKNLIDENTLCFCADGGTNAFYEYSRKYFSPKDNLENNFNIKPQIIVGDLDSIKKEVLEYYKSQNVNVEKFPPEKDFTDFELILEKVEDYEKENNFSFEKLFVIGGLGKRIDMTFSNIFLMERFRNLIFLTEDEEIFYKENSFSIENKKNYEFSIISMSSEIENLTLKGFKYELQNKTVKRKNSTLVSNIITEEKCDVEFKKGKMIVILRKKS